jgi:hypothetical protein
MEIIKKILRSKMLQDHSPSIRLYKISRFYGKEIELFHFNNRRQDNYI